MKAKTNQQRIAEAQAFIKQERLAEQAAERAAAQALIKQQKAAEQAARRSGSAPARQPATPAARLPDPAQHNDTIATRHPQQHVPPSEASAPTPEQLANARAQAHTQGLQMLAWWRLKTLREAAVREAEQFEAAQRQAAEKFEAKRQADEREAVALEAKRRAGEYFAGNYFAEILRRLEADARTRAEEGETSVQRDAGVSDIQPRTAELLGEIWQSDRVLARLAELELLPGNPGKASPADTGRGPQTQTTPDGELRRASEQAMNDFFGERWREVSEETFIRSLQHSGLAVAGPTASFIIAMFRALRGGSRVSSEP